MLSFKGIVKYTIYLFIAVWMFVLGIMVGRGNSPVTFDTQSFQERLETIAADFGASRKEEKKVDLKFYEVLDQPASQEKILVAPVAPSPEKRVVPPAAVQEVEKAEPVAVKTSTKQRTFVKKIPPSPKKSTVKRADAKKKTVKKPQKTSPNKSPNKSTGRYTLQIAAYKDFKDAVSQMAALKKKGIESYREKGVKDGETWYRVRCGAFPTYEAAKKFKAQLAKKKINSMIIKKEAHEDIKG